MSTSPLRLYRGVVDLERRTLDGPTGTVRLSPNEARLLRFLAANQDQTWSADTLLHDLWGYEAGTRSQTVFSTIRRLRAKVEVDPAHPQHIRTVDGGYRFIPIDETETGTLVGRHAELRRCLQALFDENLRQVWISGLGGIGKTRLAEELAVVVERRSLASPLFVSLDDATSGPHVLARVADALELRGAVPSARIRPALAGRAPVLLVLDDLDALGADAESTIAPLLDVSGVRVVCTARRRPDGEGWCSIALGPLRPTDSLDLLGRVSQDVGADLDAHDPDDLRALCAALDHVPLALSIAGRWLGHATPGALLRSVGMLSAGSSQRHSSVSACIAASWARLPESARTALTRVSHLGSRMPLDLALAVVGPPEPMRRLEDLHQRSLVAIDGHELRMVTAVGRFALKHSDEALATSVHNARGEWALEVSERGVDIDDHGEMQHFATVRAHILEALDGMDSTGRWHAAVVTVTKAQLLLGLDLQIDARMARLVDAARASTDPRRLGEALHTRGLVNVKTGRDAIGDLEEARHCLTEDAVTAVHVAVDLGARYRAAGRLDEATATLEHAVATARSVGNEILQARALVETGMLQTTLDDLPAAVETLQHAELLAKRLGHHRLQMLAAGARAAAERRRGRPVEAESLVRRALRSAEAVSDLENAAHLRGNLANLCVTDGRIAEAARLCRASHAHYQAHGHVRSQGFALLTLGVCSLLSDDSTTAMAELTAALDAFVVSEFPRGEASAWATMGRLRHHLGDPQGAIRFYDRALERLSMQPHTLTTRIRAMRALAWIDHGDMAQARNGAPPTDEQEPLVMLAHEGLALTPGTEPHEQWVALLRARLGSHQLERDYRWR